MTAVVRIKFDPVRGFPAGKDSGPGGRHEDNSVWFVVIDNNRQDYLIGIARQAFRGNDV